MSIDDEWKIYLKKMANEESGIVLTESFDNKSNEFDSFKEYEGFKQV